MEVTDSVTINLAMTSFVVIATAVNKTREIYTLTSKFLSAEFALLVSIMIKRESLTHWKIAVAPTQKSNQQSFTSGFFNYPSDFPVCSP